MFSHCREWFRMIPAWGPVVVFFLSVFLPVEGIDRPLPPVEARLQKSTRIQWPFVYPEIYKVGIRPGISSLQTGPTSGMAPGLAISTEFLWWQTLLGGLEYQLDFLSGSDSLSGGKVHRVQLRTGVLFQLDENERHHLALLFSPGLALLRQEAGNRSSTGFGFGLAYEYSLNSDYLLIPEFQWQRFGKAGRGWTFGIRLSFGK